MIEAHSRYIPSELPDVRACGRCLQVKPIKEFFGLGYLAVKCLDCRQTLADPRLRYRRHNAKRRNDPVYRATRKEQERTRRERLKIETLEAYGSKCACCGEDEHPFLAVDHVNGGGIKERKTEKYGGGFYFWLKKQGYPQGEYQCLCHNCNTAKACYGACPHQKAELNVDLKYMRRYREEVILAYGSKCECCSEATRQFLALHHVNNDGREHRKITRGSGTATYLWLRRNGFPRDGYGLLCHNCNLAIRNGRPCPHKINLEVKI